MNDSDLVHFYTSEEIFDEANAIFEEQKKELEVLFPNADIQHVGSCAVPNALSKFDIDIQIRVDAADFDDVVEIMSGGYDKKHPELWAEQFAIFRGVSENPIDYLVTVIDSKYDDFYKLRDYFIAHPDILQKYNELKKQYEGKSYSLYREAKAGFLGNNGDVRFLK